MQSLVEGGDQECDREDVWRAAGSNLIAVNVLSIRANGGRRRALIATMVIDWRRLIR